MDTKHAISVSIPLTGIATDTAHSLKQGITKYQGINLATGKTIFAAEIGNQTVNIGEFLALVAAVRYILENKFQPRIIYTDSTTAISWFKNMQAASKKKYPELLKAGIFLKIMQAKTNDIRLVHWNKEKWEEIPADFGYK